MSSDAEGDLERELIARDPDVELMLRVKDDDADAFGTLVLSYQNRLHGILAHVIGRADEAEDLTQEVFFRIYRSRKSYRPRSKFSTWLFTIANNLALNHIRARNRNPLSPAGRAGENAANANANSSGAFDPMALVAASGGTPSAHIRQGELAEIVRDALNNLGDDQKVAVLLNKYEDMSYAEIAVVMGKTETAVKSLLARARVNLRDQLEPYLRAGLRGPQSA